MIGEKITINGQEWEEIDYDEFESINNFDNVDNSGMFMFGANDEKLFYKKVIKEVFPKVFEGDNYNIEIDDNGNLLMRSNIDRFAYVVISGNNKETIKALKQALAFRDKMLEGKK